MSRQTKYSAALLLGLLVLLTVPLAVRAQGAFPLRPFFPGVQHITTEQLAAEYRNAIIVDVRSKFEFDVARIGKATLISFGNESFLPTLERHRAKQGKTPIIMYCNDPSCVRGYQAAQAAIINGFENVYVYDSGVFGWIKLYPDKSVLMGRTPAEPERVIPESKYNAHALNLRFFTERAYSKETVVIDIRDLFNREYVPDLPKMQNTPLEFLLEAIINRVWTEKTLLIFDADGTQTRWLQYFLECSGYIDYYFLRGGVDSLPKLDGIVHKLRDESSTVTVRQDVLTRMAADKSITNDEHRIFLYVAGLVRMENYSVVNKAEMLADLRLTEEDAINSLRRLARSGYIMYTTVNGTILVQLDPESVWKGLMEGKVWKDKMKAYGHANAGEGVLQ